MKNLLKYTLCLSLCLCLLLSIAPAGKAAASTLLNLDYGFSVSISSEEFGSFVTDGIRIAREGNKFTLKLDGLWGYFPTNNGANISNKCSEIELGEVSCEADYTKSTITSGSDWNVTIQINRPAGHSYVENTGESTAPTCQSLGTKVSFCSVCGARSEEPYDSYGPHNWSSAQADEENDVITLSCANGHSEQWPLPELYSGLTYDGSNKTHLFSGYSQPGDGAVMSHSFSGDTVNVSAQGFTLTLTAELNGQQYSVSKTYQILPATAAFTWAPITLTYGDSLSNDMLPSLNGTPYSGSEPITYSWTDGNMSPVQGLPNAPGTYTLKASIPASGNYTDSEAETSITVNPRPLTLSVSTVDREYDGTTAVQLASASVTNAVPGDDVKADLSNATATMVNADAGQNKAVTVTGIALSGKDAGKYTLSQPEGLTVNIAKKPVNITGLSVATKPYDGNASAALDSSSLASAELPQGFTVTDDGLTGTYDNANAGDNKAVSVSGNVNILNAANEDVSHNYEPVFSGVTGNILPYYITVTPTAGQYKTYGSPDPAFTYQDVTLPDDATDDPMIKLVRQAGQDVGEYAYALDTTNSNPNYRLILSDTASKFEIRPEDIGNVITVVSVTTAVYSGSEIDGLLSVTSSTELQPGVDYTVSGNVQSAVGRHIITFTGIGNYTGSTSSHFDILPDSILDSIIEDVANGTINPDNVPLGYYDRLLRMKAALDTIDDSTSHPDLATWKKAAEKLPALIEKLEEIQKALGWDTVENVLLIKDENLKVSDKENIEKAIKNIDDFIKNYSKHIDSDDVDMLEDIVKVLEDKIALIEKAEDTTNELEKWLDKYLPVADADELWLRAEYQKQLKKIDKLDKDAQKILLNSLDEKFGIMYDRLYSYYVIKGHGQYWLTSSNKGAEFTCNGHIDLFRALYIDGKELDVKNYTVKSGSTIVELSNEYMKTLSKGSHQIQFKYQDAYSTVGTFTVSDRLPAPGTSDNSNPSLWALLGLLAINGMAVSLPVLKGRKEES